MKRAVILFFIIFPGPAVLFAQEDRIVTVEPPPPPVLRVAPEDITVSPTHPLPYKLMRISSELRPSADTVPRLQAPPAPILAEPPQIDSSPPPKEQSLSIRDAIEKALAANLDIEIQRIQPRLARADTLASRGSLDPRLGLSGQYEEIADPLLDDNTSANGVVVQPGIYRNYNVGPTVTIPTAPGTTITAGTSTSNTSNTYNDFDDQLSSSLSVKIQQPLFKNFGSDVNLANIRIARKGEEISTAQFRAQVESIVQDVYFAYYELLFAQADYQAQIKSFQLAEQLGEDNAERLRVGAISPLDLSQALTDAAARKSEVIQAEGTLRIDENNLKRLLTRNLGGWLDTRIIPTDKMMAPVTAPSRADMIATGLMHRQDYIAQLKAADQQNIKILYAQNQLLPEIDLLGSYAQNSLSRTLGRSEEDLFIRKDNDWFVGLSFSVPLGARAEHGALERAKLEKEQILLQTKKVEQQIIVDVDNAALNLATTTRRVNATRQAREYAEQTLHAEEDRLKAGSSTTYNVLQLQRDLATARTDELRALADYNKAVVSLKYAQGILLSFSGFTLENP